MSRPSWLAAFVVALLGLVAPGEARAQFETPNRAFHNSTGFKLDGKHATVACTSCHLNKQFKGTPTTCFECHWVRRKDDRYQTRLGTQCEQCHRPIGWTAVKWNHAAQAGVALNASHSTLPCTTCHKNGYFKAIALNCISCHQKDYNATKAPDHRAAGFPVTCERCHNPGESTWRPKGGVNGAAFNHAAIFPLVGTHATVACQSCHKNSVYRGTPRDCVGCHQADYNATKNPNHAAAGFPTACETCHKPNAPQFTGATFNHNTVFPLAGVHAAQACQTCHKNSIYKGTPRDCVGCHQADYNRTQNPNHVAAGFPTTCETCHRSSDSQFRGATTTFNHNSVFPLVGKHAAQQCAACHKNNVFRGTPRDCVGCHQADYDRTQTPNHKAAGFPTACEGCHRPADSQWRGAGATFNHNAVFPLQGVHASQACTSCHKNNVYKGTPRTCVGCHQANYNATKNPNHTTAGFPTTCDTCHKPTSTAWTGATFNHDTVFQLVGSHATLSCASCHKANVYKGTPRTCVGCHQANYNATKNPPHVAVGFPTTCESCHKPTSTTWAGATFNHNSFFQLVGTHSTLACASCHKANVYKGTPRTCVGCHQANYNATKNPAHVAAGFPTTCDSCHMPTSTTWTGATFNHNSFFQLVGTHAALACASCHKANVYKGTPRTCVGCHQANYNATKNPAHAAAGFPTTCDSCHKPTSTTWAGATFNHNSFFQLVGTHSTLACASCHKANVYKGTSRTCVGCHQANYNATKNPAHVAAGFPTTCDSCHMPTSTTWTGATFNHNSFFQLVGTHSTLACASCHKASVYKGTPRTCVGCHQANYNATKNPAHVAAGFPTTCDSCHKPTSTTWTGATFNHNSFFQLVGTHSTLACASCHKASVYKGTPRTCVGCHQANYNATKNPAHVAAGFPTTCDACHKPTSTTWTGATFNHNSFFQLVGTHSTLACASCHKASVYKGTPRTCVGCHQANYNATKNPAHVAAGFPTTCESCHKPTSTTWTGATFNHNSFFQLVGTHSTLACASCHKASVYKGTPRTCVGCHQANYNATKNPAHAAAGFPTTCESCHKPTSTTWAGATFNHNSFFQLVGTHSTLACASCHKANVYKGTPRTCVGCHQANYNATKNPAHVAAGFPTTCESCHKPTSTTWTGATFNHNSFFQLVGTHSTLACASCHKGNVYKGTPRECIGCHQANYNATKNPAHVAAGFPTTCESCHKPTSTTWTGATFNHNAFFQLVGTHSTLACASCHKGSVYKGTPRECFGCHQATYNATKNPAHLAAGFPTTCDACHKPASTTWTGATFNHNQFFQLVGTHSTLACASCHKGSVYKGTPRECFGCHQATYNATKNPAHLAAGFPTTCDACHKPASTTWTGATFNHNQFFQLAGTHSTLACASCHKGSVYKGTPRECFGCHQATYNATKNPAHLAAGFPTTCDACHKPASTTWTGATFNHNQFFQLVGTHSTLACASCHKGSVYKGTPRECVGCHQAKYNATRNPAHVAAGFPTTCESCHRATSTVWTGATFNHNQFFQLVGTHSTLACASCHKGSVYKGTPRDCFGCHQATYNATKNPAHLAAGFPTTCESCHKSSTTWTGATFNHNQFFQLVGTHSTLACASCHKGSVYKGTPRDCFGCHQATYNATKNPAHLAAGFPTTCESCHKSSTTWTGATFNHNQFFQLVGTHTTLACASCHKGSVYKGTPRECFGCHQAKYNATKNPAHLAAGFPTTCDACHKPASTTWTGATFNHNQFFQLVGTHSTLACASCHKGSVYKGTPRDCFGCHQATYNATKNPAHLAAGFPTTCESCHKATSTVWTGATFNHNQFFQLVGTHATVACASCHKGSVYKGTPRDCVGCHQADYNATKNPAHVAAGFPTTCESCHKATSTVWTGATFNHNQFFQLVGTHATVACASCHKNNVYKGTPRTCVGCHQADYNATKNPAHVAAGFPTTCETCHTATSTVWTGATFNHASVFQLVGPHATLACASCHKNNVYKGTARTCVGCHQAKYNATTNPNHAAAGFPTTCETCHKATQTAWRPATFTHAFPRTGNHNVACAQCHTTPNNFAVYACIACHARARTDDKHRGEGGYRYESTACFACHPNGRKP